MDSKQSVRNQFAPAAAHYAESWPHRDGPDLRALIAGAGLAPTDRALDVGTGAGHTAFALAAEVASVDALDLTEAMLAQVVEGAEKRGLENLSPRCGDAEDLPYPDASFDVVASRLSAHHYAHADRAVREIARVLRPGGRLLVSDSISPPDPALDTYLNAIEVLRDPSHVRNYTTRQWEEMMSDAGLVDAECLGSFPCPLEFDRWTERMSTPAKAVAGLQALFEAAPSEVREHFSLDPQARSWSLDIAVMRARKPAA